MAPPKHKIIIILLCLVGAYGLAFYISFQHPIDLSTEKEDTEFNVTFTPPETQENIEANEGPYDETLTIAEGDTLASLLNRVGVSSSQAHEAITSLSTAFDPKDLKIDQEVYI